MKTLINEIEKQFEVNRQVLNPGYVDEVDSECIPFDEDVPEREEDCIRFEVDCTDKPWFHDYYVSPLEYKLYYDLPNCCYNNGDPIHYSIYDEYYEAELEDWLYEIPRNSAEVEYENIINDIEYSLIMENSKQIKKP